MSTNSAGQPRTTTTTEGLKFGGTAPAFEGNLRGSSGSQADRSTLLVLQGASTRSIATALHAGGWGLCRPRWSS